jgi:hypothetical protein
MSGPITAGIIVEPLAVMLAGAAIRAAQGIREGHQRSRQLTDEHAAARDESSAAQAEALRKGAAATRSEIAALEARMDSLAAAAQKLGAAKLLGAARPLRPETEEPAALAAYARSLQIFADGVQDIMLTEAARQKQDLAHEFQGIDVAAAASRPTLQSRPSLRLLERIAHLGPPPDDMAKIAQELDRTLPGERHDLLAAELRRLIQKMSESAQKRSVEEATALVVEQSLKDLGYQVEEIGSTLFVEGGVMHFRRQSWGDYMVRMRIDSKAGTANFNVVRAVEAGNNERSVMDHLAEDRWCAEFPALLKALEIQGVRLNVTRRLKAGELPVQLVERGKLPQFAEQDEGERAAKPQARSIV